MNSSVGAQNGLKRKRDPPVKAASRPLNRTAPPSKKQPSALQKVTFSTSEQVKTSLLAHKADAPRPRSNGVASDAFITRSGSGSARLKGSLQGRRFSPTNGPELGRGLSTNTSARYKARSRGGGVTSALDRASRSLPIWSHATEIRQALQKNDVLLLVGETGSGKSTQVPKFLVDQPWCKQVKVQVQEDNVLQNLIVGGCIAITEPRKVAAITLARRVALELGEPLASSMPASQVGYSVRFDHSVTHKTRIKFLTDGMLLQEMLHDPWLRKYSAVIVDEIHERGVNVDLIVGFLKRILLSDNEGRGGVPLKVIVMSATADAESLAQFFTDNPHDKSRSKSDEAAQNTPKAPNSERSDDPGEYSDWSGISSFEASSPRTQPESSAALFSTSDTDHSVERVRKAASGRRSLATIEMDSLELPSKNLPVGKANAALEDKEGQIRVSTCFIEGRQYPVQIFYSPEPVHDYVDGALRTIFQIHYAEALPGDILVFLTGQDDIEELERLINDYASQMQVDVPRIQVLPLFAGLPQAAQQRAFEPAPPKVRKIILATNIAETSVTVTGVRYVVDCGKAKVKQFRARLGLDSLLAKPISKSSAIQRKGRAGREAPGKCYRLYTEDEYLKLDVANTPEILRCDLLDTLLNIKARKVSDVTTFPFLDSPSREALQSALLQLLSIGALNPSTGDITELGQSIARLPLSPLLGRVLLAASEPQTDCLLEAIDIISCLSVENVFLPLLSEEKREAAEEVRKSLTRREGDHITLLATVQAYASEKSDRKLWAERHFVSHRALASAMDIRKQLRLHCQRQGLLGTSELSLQAQVPAITPERSELILKCFLKAFASRTAMLAKDGSYRTIQGNQTVSIHPSSGLFGKKVEAIMYDEFVYTNRSYARTVSAVQLDWITENIVE